MQLLLHALRRCEVRRRCGYAVPKSGRFPEARLQLLLNLNLGHELIQKGPPYLLGLRVSSQKKTEEAGDLSE